MHLQEAAKKDVQKFAKNVFNTVFLTGKTQHDTNRWIPKWRNKLEFLASSWSRQLQLRTRIIVLVKFGQRKTDRVPD